MPAEAKSGELLTKPILFEDKTLTMNFSANAVGSVRIEMPSGDGVPVDGLSLADFPPIHGNEITRALKWNLGTSLASLAGQPICLRFVLSDVDLYSIKFR